MFIRSRLFLGICLYARGGRARAAAAPAQQQHHALSTTTVTAFYGADLFADVSKVSLPFNKDSRYSKAEPGGSGYQGKHPAPALEMF